MEKLAKIEDIGKLEETINPYFFTGIAPWLLKSLSDEQLRDTLKTFKRSILGKHHHPDLYQDPTERAKHEIYFSRAVEAIDKLLDSSSLRRVALKEYQTDDEIGRNERKVRRREEEIKKIRGEKKELEGKLEEAQLSATTYMRGGSDLKEDERLFFLNGATILTDSFKGRVSYVRFYDDNNFFANKLGDQFSRDFNTDQINLASEEYAKEFIRKHCSNETDSRKRKPKRLIEERRAVGNKLFHEDENPIEILGTVTWYALGKYLSNNGKTLLTGRDLSYSATEPGKVKLWGDFTTDVKGTDFVMPRVAPYLAPGIKKGYLALTRQRQNRRNVVDHYGLILPTRIKKGARK